MPGRMFMTGSVSVTMPCEGGTNSGRLPHRIERPPAWSALNYIRQFCTYWTTPIWRPWGIPIQRLHIWTHGCHVWSPVNRSRFVFTNMFWTETLEIEVHNRIEVVTSAKKQFQHKSRKITHLLQFTSFIIWSEVKCFLFDHQDSRHLNWSHLEAAGPV